MTGSKKTILATLLILGLAVPVVLLQQRARNSLLVNNGVLREQCQALSQAQTENLRLSNLLAQAKIPPSLSPSERNELLKLRGKANQTQTAVRELATLKATAEQEERDRLHNLTNSFASTLAGPLSKIQKQEALLKLDRMKAHFNLSDEQREDIENILMERIRVEAEGMLNAMAGKMTKEQRAAADEKIRSQSKPEIQALLTPEQLAAYPEFEQKEIALKASSIATADARELADDFKLSPALRDQVYVALYSRNLERFSGADRNEIAASTSGEAEVGALHFEFEKRGLEKKLKVLEDILTPEQIKAHYEENMQKIERQRKMMKAYQPKVIGQ